MELLGIGLDMMSVLITFVILVGVLLGKKNAMNEYFPTLLLLNAGSLFVDIGVLTFFSDPTVVFLLRFFCMLQGAFIFVSICGVNLYVDKLITRKAGKKPMYRVIPFLISLGMIMFWITSLFTGYAFSVSDDGEYVWGKYIWIFFIVAGVLFIYIFLRVAVNQINEVLDKNICMALYLFILFPMLCAIPAVLLKNFSILFAGFTVSYLVMYMMIHVHMERMVVEQKMDNTIMQTDLIISQLQPHFMFNSLTNIMYLIPKDQRLAMEATEKFSKYLRQNLDSITNTELISFAQEMEHTRNYLWMEQLRFKDLKVNYSIDAENFLIPPLSLQPVVENAVKHGVTKKIGGGTIEIIVRELPDCYKIVVRDDGVGFDRAKNVEDTQVGIMDIRKRLLAYNKSTVSIASTEGVGTTVTYLIRKDEE